VRRHGLRGAAAVCAVALLRAVTTALSLAGRAAFRERAARNGAWNTREQAGS